MQHFWANLAWWIHFSTKNSVELSFLTRFYSMLNNSVAPGIWTPFRFRFSFRLVFVDESDCVSVPISEGSCWFEIRNINLFPPWFVSSSWPNSWNHDKNIIKLTFNLIDLFEIQILSVTIRRNTIEFCKDLLMFFFYTSIALCTSH